MNEISKKVRRMSKYVNEGNKERSCKEWIEETRKERTNE